MSRFLPFQSGIDPDPDEARRWLERELLKPEYQPNPITRLKDWFFDRMDDVLNRAFSTGGFSVVAGAVILVLLVALVVFIAIRLRRDPTSATSDPTGSAPLGADRSASAHHAAARAALAEGKHEVAVVEGVRAIAQSLVERTILIPTPGTTAREMSAVAGRAFPAQAVTLREVADLFDRVQYGARSATRDEAQKVLDLHEGLLRTAPRLEGAR